MAMTIASLDSSEARFVGNALEGVWNEMLQTVGPLMAWYMTMLQELGEDELTGIIGPDIMQEGHMAIQDLDSLWGPVKLLDQGTHVLLPWIDPEARRIEGTPVMHFAIVDRKAIPPEAGLGVWRVVTLATLGLLVAAAYVVVKFFDVDVQKLKAETAMLRTKVFERMQANVAAIAKTDPIAAARIAEANAKALAAQTAAERNARGWLDRFFDTIGGAVEGATAPLMWLAVFWFLSQMGKNKAAA